MAKINKSDIIDDKVIIKAFNEVNEALKTTSKYFNETAKDAIKLQTAIGSIKGFNDLIKAQKEYDSVQKDAITTQKQMIDLQQKEVKLRESTAKAQIAEQKATDAQTKSANAANKEAEKTAKNLAKETSLYAQHSKALTDARNRAKELALQYGVNSKEFKKAADEVNKLDKSLKDIDGKLGQHQRNVGNYAKAWDSAKLVWAAVGTAIIAFGKKVLDLNVNFQKASASLRAITGATREDMKFYEAQAKSMGAAFGIAGDEMLKSFERVGSIRPELLKTKEALVQVTESAIVLSQASGGMLDLVGATEALGAGMNQFNLTAKDSDRIINALAAGSQIGSAEVASLAESFKNVGAVANNANMSLEDTVAALEVLGEKSLYGAEAGTKLRGTILKLQEAGKGFASGKFNLKDALTETKSQLDSIADPIEKATYLQKMFGIENQTAGIIMLQNIDKYTKFREGVEGTTVAFDQQAIQMDTISGEWNKLSSTWDSILTSGWFSESIKWIVKWGNEALKTGFGFKTFFQSAQSAATETADVWMATIAKLPIEEQAKKLEGAIKIVNDAIAEGSQVEENTILLKTYSDELSNVNDKIKESNAVMAIRLTLADKSKEALIGEQALEVKRLETLEAENKASKSFNIERLQEIGVAKLNIIALDQEIASRNKLTTAIQANNTAKTGSPTPKKENIAKLSSITATPLVDTTELDMDQVNADALIDLDKWKNDKLAEQRAEALAKDIAETEEHQRKVQEIRDNIGNEALATGKDLVNTMFEIQQNNYDKEIKLIQDRATIALDNANLTEDQRKQIEAQRDADILRIENKRRESQRKQFIINKAIALAEIGVNTARAVMATLGETGFFGLPLSVLVGALGAAQAAVVLAQPMPAFDKGTDNAPNTPFLVGERGAEFVTKNGKTQLVTEPTVMNNMGGAKITSRIETARILEANNRNAVWSALNKGEQMNSYNELLAAQNRTNDILKQKQPIKIYNSTGVISRAQIGRDNLINKLRR